MACRQSKQPPAQTGVELRFLDSDPYDTLMDTPEMLGAGLPMLGSGGFFEAMIQGNMPQLPPDDMLYGEDDKMTAVLGSVDDLLGAFAPDSHLSPPAGSGPRHMDGHSMLPQPPPSQHEIHSASASAATYSKAGATVSYLPRMSVPSIPARPVEEHGFGGLVNRQLPPLQWQHQQQLQQQQQGQQQLLQLRQQHQERQQQQQLQLEQQQQQLRGSGAGAVAGMQQQHYRGSYPDSSMGFWMPTPGPQPQASTVTIAANNNKNNNSSMLAYVDSTEMKKVMVRGLGAAAPPCLHSSNNVNNGSNALAGGRASRNMVAGQSRFGPNACMQADVASAADDACLPQMSIPNSWHCISLPADVTAASAAAVSGLINAGLTCAPWVNFADARCMSVPTVAPSSVLAASLHMAAPNGARVTASLKPDKDSHSLYPTGANGAAQVKEERSPLHEGDVWGWPIEPVEDTMSSGASAFAEATRQTAKELCEEAREPVPAAAAAIIATVSAAARNDNNSFASDNTSGHEFAEFWSPFLLGSENDLPANSAAAAAIPAAAVGVRGGVSQEFSPTPAGPDYSRLLQLPQSETHVRGIARQQPGYQCPLALAVDQQHWIPRAVSEPDHGAGMRSGSAGGGNDTPNGAAGGDGGAASFADSANANANELMFRDSELSDIRDLAQILFGNGQEEQGMLGEEVQGPRLPSPPPLVPPQTQRTLQQQQQQQEVPNIYSLSPNLTPSPVVASRDGSAAEVPRIPDVPGRVPMDIRDSGSGGPEAALSGESQNGGGHPATQCEELSGSDVVVGTEVGGRASSASKALQARAASLPESLRRQQSASSQPRGHQQPTRDAQRNVGNPRRAAVHGSPLGDSNDPGVSSNNDSGGDEGVRGHMSADDDSDEDGDASGGKADAHESTRGGRGGGGGGARARPASKARTAAREAVNWPEASQAGAQTGAGCELAAGEAEGGDTRAMARCYRRAAVGLTQRALSQHYHRPIKEVAKELGLSLSCFKKECRRLGVPRWPARKLNCLTKMRATVLAEPKPAHKDKQGILELMQRNIDEIMSNPEVPMYKQFTRLRHEQYKMRSGCRRGGGGAGRRGRVAEGGRRRRSDDDTCSDEDSGSESDK